MRDSVTSSLRWEVIGRQGSTHRRSDWSPGSGIVAWPGMLVIEFSVTRIPTVLILLPIIPREVLVLVSSVVRHVPEAVADLVGRSIASVVWSSLLELGSASSSSSVETSASTSVVASRHFSAKVIDVRRWLTLLTLLTLLPLLVSLLRLIGSRTVSRGAILATLRSVALITPRSLDFFLRLVYLALIATVPPPEASISLGRSSLFISFLLLRLSCRSVRT